MSEENLEQTDIEKNLPKKKWVKFEDDVKSTTSDNANNIPNKPAVIEPESVQLNVTSPQKNASTFTGAILPTESVHINVNHTRSLDTNNSGPSQNINMRTIDLHETSNGVSSLQTSSVIRQGFGSYISIC